MSLKKLLRTQRISKRESSSKIQGRKKSGESNIAFTLKVIGSKKKTSSSQLTKLRVYIVAVRLIEFKPVLSFGGSCSYVNFADLFD